MSNELLTLWQNWQGGMHCNFSAKTWTPDELRNHTEVFAEALRLSGVRPKSTIAMVAGNTVGFPLALMSILRIGCIPLLLHASTPQSEIDEISERLLCTYFIHDNLDGITRLDLDAMDCLTMYEIDRVTLRLLHTKKPVRGRLVQIPDDIILHQTSGTLGKSKYCMRSQRAASAEAVNYTKTIDIYSQSRVSVTTPLSHAFAFGFGFVSSLLTHSILDIYHVFNPRLLFRNFNHNHTDILAIVPSMVKVFVQASHRNQASMPKHVFTAGARCDNQIRAEFKKHFDAELYQIYGTTETGGISTTYSRTGSLSGVGRPLQNVLLSLSSDIDYSEIRDGAGELIVTSTSMMNGYLGQESAIPDSWPTQDIAYYSLDNSLHLVGRVDEIINVNGQKLDPLEVENVLLSHAGIEDAVVYAGINDENNEFAQAAVVKNGNFDFDDRELRRFCYERLASHKVPVIYHFLPEIRRSPSGKCLKVLLPDFPIRKPTLRTNSAEITSQ